MKHPRSGVCQSGGVSLCCLQNLSLFIPFNELSGILPALLIHGFQCLLVFRQGRHALGAVRRNDTHDAQSRTSVQRESRQQKSSSAEAELPERFLRVAAPSIRFVPWAALASCWPRPQQLLPVSAAGGGRRRCTCRTEVRKAVPLTRDVAHLGSAKFCCM